MKLREIFNYKVLIFSIVMWAIFLFSGVQDYYFYDFELLNETQKLVCISCKILNIAFIHIISLVFYHMLKNRKNAETRKRIAITLSYFAIIMLVLVLIWPGAWSWDDVWIVSDAQYYFLTPWQHFFSGLLHVLCLQLIPIPTGVLIIQSLLASFIVGYCVTKLSSLAPTLKSRLVLTIILFVMLLSPPLVVYILTGFRMGFYSYLELLLVTKVFILFKQGTKATLTDLMAVCVLTIIVGSWRTEAIYYPVAMFFILWIMGKNIITFKRVVIVSLCSMLAILGIGKYNTHLVGNNNYSLTATVAIVAELVRVANESDQEELALIDKVMDVEYILNNSQKTGEQCYWSGGVVSDYSEEDYSGYISAFVKLCVKYPLVALKTATDIFIQTGSGVYYNGIIRAVLRNDIYDGINEASLRWMLLDNTSALNEELRNNTLHLLSGLDDDFKPNLIYFFGWNLFIPLITIIALLIYKLVKKEFFMVLLLLTILGRVPLVFVTSSAPYFMYYLSTYVCISIFGSVFIFELVLKLLENKKATQGSVDKKPKSVKKGEG